MIEEDSSFNIFHKLDFSEHISEEIFKGPELMHRPSCRNESVLQELCNLGKAKDRFKDFLEELGELKRRPIREDIISYCGDPKRTDKVVDHNARPEALIKKMDIRIDKMIKTRRIKRNWGQEDLKILVWIVSKYCDLHRYSDLEKDITDQDWEVIASYIPGVTPESCMFKWLSIKKVTLANYRWLEEESQLLQRIVIERLNSQESEGIKEWKDISQQLYRLNEDESKVFRNAKQCKEHWNCHLNPELKKGLWQPEQDIKLLKFIRDNKGLKKWSELSRYFDGRTENALKNRHKLIVQKLQKQAKNRHKDELHLISEYLEKMMVDQLTSNHVMYEEDMIFEEHSEIKLECEVMTYMPPTPVKKPDIFQETQDHPITPSRVEKFDLGDLKRMDFRFIKNIQPGRMESNGLFKKMNDSKESEDKSRGLSAVSECKQQFVEQLDKPKGPFSIVPLSFWQ